MFGILLIIAGIVGLAINHLFTGQETISWVLIGTGGGLIVLNLLIVIVGALFFNKTRKDIDRRW